MSVEGETITAVKRYRENEIVTLGTVRRALRQAIACGMIARPEEFIHAAALDESLIEVVIDQACAEARDHEQARLTGTIERE